MEIKVASTAGFCFGVQRAVDKVYELMKSETLPIYTLGPIIHNEFVVAELSRGGVKAIADSDIESVPRGIVVIRSHGVGREYYERIRKAGHQLVDATCPFVLKIHRIVEKESGAGRQIIVIGDPSILRSRGSVDGPGVLSSVCAAWKRQKPFRILFHGSAVLLTIGRRWKNLPMSWRMLFW